MKQLHPLRQILHSTTRLEVVTASGEVGHGTGFFMELANKDTRHVPTIITNKHVLENAATLRFPLTICDSSGDPGGYEIVQLPASALPIVKHPDKNVDLAGIPFAPILHEMNKQGKNPYFAAFPQNFIADDAYMAELYPMEEVAMIGYPNAIWDSHNNSPVIRKGIIASDPAKKYNGKEEFICDIAAFPGSSGSPVMLLNHGSYINSSGNISMGSRIKLLGILYAGPQHNATGEIKIVNIPTTQMAVSISRIPNNIGIMIKAKMILEIDALLLQMGRG